MYKKKKKYKVILHNTVDPHTQHSKPPPVGRNVVRDRKKKPFDNMKVSNGGVPTTELRRLVRQTGTLDEQVNLQRRMATLTSNTAFTDSKKKTSNYGYKLIK